MKNILVTGGHGFIGSNLVNALCQNSQNKVVVVDRNPLQLSSFHPESKFKYYQLSTNDTIEMEEVIKENLINIVYHVAWANFNATVQNNIISDVNTNIASSVSLFDSCVKNKVTRIIYVSSGGTVYGKPEILPIDENHPKNPVTAYGVSKFTVENYLRMYSAFYGIESIILRPSVPYGPNQNPLRGQGAVTTFLYKALKKETICIWGDGSSKRDFFYISDLVDAMLIAISIPYEPKDSIFNIAGSQIYALSDIVEIIHRVSGLEVKVEYQSSRQVDIPCIYLSTANAFNKLKWVQKVKIEQGVLKTFEWLKEKYG